MDLDLRATVEGWISDFILEYCRRTGTESIWRASIVGLADAESPLFPELRIVAYRGHRVPQDYLPGARTVISYFLPFELSVAEGNVGGDAPSQGWVDAYKVTNAMAAELNRYIADRVEEMGFSAVVPEDAGVIVDGTYSVWSQRHIARIAGLGSFGMNNMLITRSGCCGRFFSIITDVPCVHDAPFTGERCLHRLDGSCGRCMSVCPMHAISDDGFDRTACGGICESNIGLLGADVCGKCIVGMPCTSRDPSDTRGENDG